MNNFEKKEKNFVYAVFLFYLVLINNLFGLVFEVKWLVLLDKTNYCTFFLHRFGQKQSLFGHAMAFHVSRENSPPLSMKYVSFEYEFASIEYEVSLKKLDLVSTILVTVW